MQWSDFSGDGLKNVVYAAKRLEKPDLKIKNLL
jgi:hypothetical protein